MSEKAKRRRSKDAKCRKCALCEHSSTHCWAPDDIDEDDLDISQSGIDVAFEDGSGCLWLCRHCPAWMEMMPDDDEDETDLDAAWNEAVEAE